MIKYITFCRTGRRYGNNIPNSRSCRWINQITACNRNFFHCKWPIFINNFHRKFHAIRNFPTCIVMPETEHHLLVCTQPLRYSYVSKIPIHACILVRHKIPVFINRNTPPNT